MGRKILLADDSITIQKVVNLTFSDEGIDVVTVGNGELAVRKLNDVRPDIVLADIYMPGKNGYEVCEYIKTNPQFAHVPVLLLVGAFEPFDQAEAVRVKADGHLTKPFESRALVATVTRLLAQAPPAPIASPPPPPVVASPAPTTTWQAQPVPPDATTTRLTPEMAARFQASFPAEPHKAEPLQAKPMTLEPTYQPLKASPVPLETFETFAPPMAAPATNNFQPSPANSGFEMNFSNDAPPPFASTLAATPFSSPPPMAASAVSIPANPFQTDIPLTFPAPAKEPEQMEELDLPDDELESTQIMGSSVRRSLAAPIDNEATMPIDSMSPLELDEVDMSPGSSASQLDGDVFTEDVMNRDRGTLPGTNNIFGHHTQTTSYSTGSMAENQYEEIMPLDLEPLDEIGYQSNSQDEALLDLSSPLPMEELPSIDTDDVLEESSGVDESLKQELADEQQKTLEYSAFAKPDSSIEMARTTGPLDIGRTTGTMFELVPEEASATTEYSDMMPSELRSMMNNSAAAAPAEVENSFTLSSPPPQPLPPAAPLPYAQEEVPDLFQAQPVQAQPADEWPTPQPIIQPRPIEFMPAPVVPPLPEPVAPVWQESENVASAYSQSEPVDSPLELDCDPEPLPLPAITQPPPINHQPLPIEAPAVVYQPISVAAASGAITSIDQIPQHLIDEIVRRAIVQMSEEVVREIAWEVVPDLAELLIKKRLEQKPAN